MHFVSHQHLANVVWKDDEYEIVEEIIIDAPNIKSFEYSGGLTSFPGIKASHGLEFVRLHLRPKVLNARSWYIWLRTILESFAHSGHLTLICRSEQQSVRSRIWNFKIDSSTATSQNILDGFIWILPGLKTLSLTLGSISKIIEFHRG
ncbi:uncharacterized protein LOC132048367 [Lycium ferocissimum]|uniref:uncharacterized protein LOC132048367 n=1 Tax=Lycium ferocissimum TaxID=112874 RepID=UPI002815E08D|nr:uncharacterized protein LOC132048367 [Lycium ferocissimum]